MKHTWMFIIPPIAIAVIIFVVWYRYRIHSHDRDLKRVAVIAHTKTIKMLPAYRKAARHYRILMACAAIAFATALFSLTAAAARPTSRDERKSESEKRDIILCMDISGSMKYYQEELLGRFKKIISDPDMREQRIGVTIFDGKPANLIPPTDDYDALIETITSLSESFEDSFSIKRYNNPISSRTATLGNSSSAIGDGVMGCVNSLDLSEENQRAKSVIIATDNAYGTNSQSVDIGQVARYAQRYNVAFYGLYIPGGSSKQKNEFIDATKITNGMFYSVSDYYDVSYNTDTKKTASTGNYSAVAKDADHTIESIIHEIMDQETAKMEGAPEIIYTDQPSIALYASIIFFTLFATLVWRLRL